ncbi:hypothetical protein NPIL_546481 [Nephila pilipes]|uniref:Uncharacterized protein n=1 Tax=Nephila pilipes TaxID=299642 RepID=A0A8X6QKK1_NEPPI|nr:hypothetical protein NPIL_546481 [Nephila pilipes]
MKIFRGVNQPTRGTGDKQEVTRFRSGLAFRKSTNPGFPYDVVVMKLAPDPFLWVFRRTSRSTLPRINGFGVHFGSNSLISFGVARFGDRTPPAGVHLLSIASSDE